MISLDGYFTDSNGGIDWHTVDDEFNRFAIEQLESCDTILFGRVTYKMFEDYWPDAAKDPQTGPDDLKIASYINDAIKIVFSKTLESVTWQNSQLKAKISTDEIRKLKAATGKNIVIFGSGTIVQQLTNLGLIDEYRLMISPIILGSGKALFNNVHKMPNLKLLEARSFANGNVLLRYS